MRKLLIGICVLVSLGVQGQELERVQDLIIKYSENNTLINILQKYGGADAIEAQKGGDLLAIHIEGDLLPDSLMSSNEKIFFKENFHTINRFYLSIKNIGNQPPKLFVVENKKEGFVYPIINIGKFKNDTVLVTSGIYDIYAFNRLKIEEKERAKEVLLKLSIPFSYNLKSLIETNGINRFCVISGYTNKDFSDKNDDGVAETLAIIFHKDDLKQYYDAEISDSELISRSDVLYTNENIQGNLKKVEFQ